MEGLFPELLEESPPAKPAGPFAVVAIEQAIDRVLDYAIPRKLSGQLKIGQRVRVPLGRGNKPVSGYVVAFRLDSEHPKIKSISDLVDDRVLVSPQLMQLARWISKYYVTPLGVVFESVIPSAVKKRIGLGYSSLVFWNIERQSLQSFFEKTKAPKRRALLSRLLQLQPEEGIEIVRLAGEAGVKTTTVRKLAKMGIIRIVQKPDLEGLAEEANHTSDNEPPRELNPDQQRVFDDLSPRLAAGGQGGVQRQSTPRRHG